MEQILLKLAELENKVKALEAAATIPYEVDSAFRERFGLNRLDSTSLIASSKGATSENHAVNEAGIATYSVLGIPDGYLEVTVGGSVKYIPIYT